MSFGINAITKDTRLSLAVVVVIVSAVAGGAWWIGNEITKTREQIGRMERDIYTLSAASETALRMAIENPGLIVPDPRDPRLMIRVRAAEVQRQPPTHESSQ